MISSPTRVATAWCFTCICMNKKHVPACFHCNTMQHSAWIFPPAWFQPLAFRTTRACDLKTWQLVKEIRSKLSVIIGDRQEAEMFLQRFFLTILINHHQGQRHPYHIRWGRRGTCRCRRRRKPTAGCCLRPEPASAWPTNPRFGNYQPVSLVWRIP